MKLLTIPFLVMLQTFFARGELGTQTEIGHSKDTS